MAGATDKSGAAAARGRTFREKWAGNWLARLRRLPEPVFRECVRRLQEGDTAIAVARWLLTLPNRAGMQGVSNLHTMRRYLEVLRVRVRAAKKKVPLPAVTANQLKKMVEQERQGVDNEIAIEGGPMKREPEPILAPPDAPAEREPANVIATGGEPMKYEEASPAPPPPVRPEDRPVRQTMSMIDYVVARNAKASDRRTWLSAVAESNWERLQLARWLEEKVKMPLAEATKISNVMISAADAYTRAELAGITKQKLLGTNAKENVNPLTIDGVPLDQLPPRLQHLRQQVGAMTVQDRMLIRAVLDQVLHIMDLKLKIKRAEDAKAAAAPPDPPPEGGKANE
jgi:hypothetical protein